MRFKVEENLPAEVTITLRRIGHDAHSVLDENLSGAPDSSIAKVCQTEQRVLVTLDLDFAHLWNYPPKDFHGIIVLRPTRQDRQSVLAILHRVLTLLQTFVDERLWIVDDTRTRIRGES